MIAGVVCGNRFLENWADATQPVDFYDIKGDLESIFALTGLPGNFEFSAVTHPALQRGQSAEILRDGKNVGFVGLIDPGVQHNLDIKIPIFLFELKLDALITKSVSRMGVLSRYPEVRRDIAIIVDQGVKAADIQASVEKTADDSLQNLKLFDVYQGKGIESNRKSLALGLTFQHPSRTLTDEEINSFIDEIVVALESEFGARLRN